MEVARQMHPMVCLLISSPSQHKHNSICESAPWISKEFANNMWTWDKRTLNPTPAASKENKDGTYSMHASLADDLRVITPAKYAFKGKVIALTSHNNSSGSTNLLANIRAAGNTTLVGEKTGGSAQGTTAGILFTLTLPESKITTRIPFSQFTNNVKDFEKGMGVSPDIFATNTVESVLAQEDEIFKRALELAKQN
jgi:C-terminal processing protease CtpA/Prc